MATDVSGLTAAILDAAPTICEEAAQLMKNDVDLSAPIDTGALIQSGSVEVGSTGSGAAATLRYTEEYASYLEDGTGPHTITGNPLLSFSWGGQQVIVHSVQHPGSVKWREWFSRKAEDESLWALQVQAVLSSSVIF